MQNIISKKGENVRYCLECGTEMQQFFLPLYDYENQFCERCEIDDYEGKCHCS
jgi:hypothetical protein